MAKYGKTQGHHCWWLTVNGKEIANFDNESDVDEIIALDVLQTNIKNNYFVLPKNSTIGLISPFFSVPSVEAKELTARGFYEGWASDFCELEKLQSVINQV